MSINKYRVDELKIRIDMIMQTGCIDARVLNKWHKYDLQEKICELDKELWNAWFEYLTKYGFGESNDYKADDTILEFTKYTEKYKDDWIFYAECSSILLKYIKAKNRLIV